MIVLHWHQPSDNRMEATHDGRTFVIAMIPNWDKHPAMSYDHRASVTHNATVLQLGDFQDSKAARDRCAQYVNQTAGDSRG